MKHTVKRDGTIVEYDRNKIISAIRKANKELDESKQVSDDKIYDIIGVIESIAEDNIHVEDIQDIIERKLMDDGKFELAKKYILYRYNRALIRKSNSTDDSILSLIKNNNVFLNEENSNKNAFIASTQRDLIAGEVSRDLTKRLLLPEEIVKAHEDGILHFHDMDYFVQPIFNCCLINISDMLDNGTVMNGKMIESPKSFQVACTVTTQIISTIASSQYGGQSVDIKHLGKYLRKSREKYQKQCNKKYGETVSQSIREQWVNDRVTDELKAGIQTIQYQINTLMTTNGQAPFVTLFLHLDETNEYIEEIAMIIKEILNQRLQGIKNEKGVYVTPAFPKLIYVLDENNCLNGGRFDDITKLAAKCSTKRLYPDYISAKKMKENYEGNIYSPMGCRSFLSTWKNTESEYKFEGRFNQGVVSLNLPQIGIIAKGDMETFWSLLEERLSLCFKALMVRHHALEGTLSDVSPVHWQYGAIARLEKGEKIDKLLHNGYSTISLGYIGLYEVTKLMTGESHTTEKGEKFAQRLMKRLRMAADSWKAETSIAFGLYGTPAESLCYRFAEVDRKRFGDIKDITDKGYYTNSYHVDVREDIDAFLKFDFESQFQITSSGGAISYVEIPNMQHNLEAVETLIKYIYDNIQYAEFNTKSDYCHLCGFEGEIILKDNNGKLTWTCPQCGNQNYQEMNVTRRTCGYLGSNYWNEGKTKEINDRVLHI